MLCPDCKSPVKSWLENCTHCGADVSHQPAKRREGSQPIWVHYPVR